MPKSIKSNYPAHDGWLHCKFNFNKGESMTEDELKKALLLGNHEADYEFALVKSYKTVGRVIFRKKRSNYPPNGGVVDTAP